MVSVTWLMTMIIKGCRVILMTEAQKEQMSCSSEILASEFELMLNYSCANILGTHKY